MKHSNINFLTLGFLLLVGIFLWGYYDLVQDCNQEAYSYREQILRNQQEYLTLQSKKYNAITLLEKHRNDSALFQKSVQALKSELEQDTIAWRSGAEAMMRDTKSLIDLHLNAVDRQYNSLTLWAAVITILFLIFSFYAIFKLEDTLKQARDVVNDVEKKANGQIEEMKSLTEKVKTDSKQHLQDIETKAKDLFKSIKTGTREISNEANKQQEVIQLLSDGLNAYNNKEYELAIEKYKQAAELDPHNSSIYNRWGVALAKLALLNKNVEMLNSSISMYEKAISLKPNYVEAYNNLGNALVRLGRLNENASQIEESFTKYAKAIELKPNYAVSYYNWGMALYHLAKLTGKSSLIKQSFPMYEKAIELKPNYISAYIHYVNAIWRLAKIENNFESHKSKLEKLLLKIEHLQENEGTYNLASLYSLVNEKDQAFEWLEKDLKINSNKRCRNVYEQDSDFDNIKSDPRFKELLDRYYPEEDISTTEK